MTAPGPAPDRAAAELARAEADWRATPPDLAGWVSLSRDASQALMAEYDRRGAVIAAVLAYLDKVEEDSEMFRRMHGGGLMPAIVEVPRIRALLEGEGR